MKRLNFTVSLLVGLICGAFLLFDAAGACARTRSDEVNAGPMMNVAYVASSGKEIPDPKLMTHIIYSNAVIKDDLKGIEINNPEYFKEIVNLREQKPGLKVCLSIVDNGKGGMSQMCGDKRLRKEFVKNVKKIVKEYDLDGIDFDWEFPTVNKGTSIGRPEDSVNYAKLAKETRKALGKNKMLTVYSNNSALWLDFPLMVPYLDYVMASGYNIGLPPVHQSNLYNSDRFKGWSISKSIERHHEYGVPYSKLMIGIPFYARNVEMMLQSGSPFTYLDRWKWKDYFKDFTMEWDEEAQAPYYVDNTGKVVATFDTPQSIAAKAEFAKSKGLAGGFYWHYGSEDSTHQMAKAMHENFK
ncbi:MAG: hypothetical protein K2K29_07045 [Muribaculaceae bacterium]|nr:hypothetical protein [Muribaculaceae bacterium]